MKTFKRSALKTDWKDKIALVTGASSGIGAATTRKFTQEGMQVDIVARRLPRLQSLAKEIQEAGRKAEVIEVDLTPGIRTLAYL
jgi:NADP-dependent 3-hydroxy acid dehydrogenase YdfG